MKKKTRIFFFFLMFFIVIALMTGCVFQPAAQSPNPVLTTRPIIQVSAPPLPSIADVVALVEPSVVAIDTEAVSYDMAKRAQVQKGAGSGWILDESGLIVTNNHVIEGATTVTVTFRDGRAFLADIAGTDPYTDVAIVKVNGVSNLTASRVGDASKMRVGDWVVTIGNPLGFGISAKQGIVSRLGVSVEVSQGQILHNLIETSAAINPGNSGGPLVNMSGQVIGITSYKIGTLGVEGMGYAINIDDVVPIVQQLVATGCVIRPWFGPTLTTVDQTVASRYRLAVNQGAMVTGIPAGSPADKAGIAIGDVIVSFGGTEITNVPQLTSAIHASKAGQMIQVTFWRDNTKKTVDTILVESPPCK